jgi:glycerophosphoryl diester phosphodiesterase
VSGRHSPNSQDDGAAALSSRFRAALFAQSSCPLVIAHRGDSSGAPENTLVAAQLGHDAGADAWEFDVHLTRDGAAVVIHDESLLRTTDVARRFAFDPRREAGYLVSQFDLEEILTLDAGTWFLDPDGGFRTASRFGTLSMLAREAKELFASGTVRVPTLVEALELTDRLDWLANVEVKSFPNTNSLLLDAVLAAVDKTGTASRVLISSFDHADVARAARRRPEIPTGVLASTPIERPSEYARDLVGAVTYHPSHLVLGAESDYYVRTPSASTLRTSDLASLKQANVPVLVYTVNDVSADGLAVHLAEAGVRGLFTDFPRSLRKLLRSPRS